MPISTLWAKSMPSTNSRKPCTKCCLDISPSVTMSMPASSCSFSASKVASAFAAASSSPASFHCGHSLFGSASHGGLGRLPAIVVSNMCGGTPIDTLSVEFWNLRGVRRAEAADRGIDRVAEPLDDGIDLLRVDDERRREQHMIAARTVDRAAGGIDHQAARHRLALDARIELELRIERHFGRAVLDQL